MRSLAPSITLTCTLMVSPGLKAGMSSRSDALSTKSSVFMSETLPCGSRLRAAGHAAGVWAVKLADGFGLSGCISQQAAAYRPADNRWRQLVNCARLPARSEITANRRHCLPHGDVG